MKDKIYSLYSETHLYQMQVLWPTSNLLIIHVKIPCISTCQTAPSVLLDVPNFPAPSSRVFTPCFYRLTASSRNGISTVRTERAHVWAAYVGQMQKPYVQSARHCRFMLCWLGILRILAANGEGLFLGLLMACHDGCIVQWKFTVHGQNFFVVQKQLVF